MKRKMYQIILIILNNFLFNKKKNIFNFLIPKNK